MAITNKKTALITGGASGMGLAVAQNLQKLGWNIATVDIHPGPSTTEAEESQASSLYIRANVTIYEEMLNAFRKAKEKFGSIDFVFANAGIIGRSDFYDVQELNAPTAPSLAVQEICLTGVIYTSHLAMHFMRQNEIPGGVIIMTASAASLYATPDLPIYTSSKHGVLGLMRSMSARLSSENIRVNAVLPGAIKTSLHSDKTWSQFDQSDFTPVEEIVGTVLKLIEDSGANGAAMEVSKGEVFDRKQPEFCNEPMRRIMTGSSY